MKKMIIITSVLLVCIAIGFFVFFFQKKNSVISPETEVARTPSSEVEEQPFIETNVANFTWDENKVLLNDLFPPNKGEGLKKVLASVYTEYPEDYRLFSCNGGRERGLLLIAESNLENLDDPYFEARRSILEWEPYMASDLQFLLFPEMKGQITSPATFEDRSETIRKGSFSTTEGIKDIYYGWTGNYIAFTSTEECLNTAHQTAHPED